MPTSTRDPAPERGPADSSRTTHLVIERNEISGRAKVHIGDRIHITNNHENERQQLHARTEQPLTTKFCLAIVGLNWFASLTLDYVKMAIAYLWQGLVLVCQHARNTAEYGIKSSHVPLTAVCSMTGPNAICSGAASLLASFYMMQRLPTTPSLPNYLFCKVFSRMLELVSSGLVRRDKFRRQLKSLTWGDVRLGLVGAVWFLAVSLADYPTLLLYFYVRTQLASKGYGTYGMHHDLFILQGFLCCPSITRGRSNKTWYDDGEGTTPCADEPPSGVASPITRIGKS